MRPGGCVSFESALSHNGLPAEFEPTSSSVTLRKLPVGEYVLSVRAMDSANNLESVPLEFFFQVE